MTDHLGETPPVDPHSGRSASAGLPPTSSRLHKQLISGIPRCCAGSNSPEGPSRRTSSGWRILGCTASLGWQSAPGFRVSSGFGSERGHSLNGERMPPRQSSARGASFVGKRAALTGEAIDGPAHVVGGPQNGPGIPALIDGWCSDRRKGSRRGWATSIGNLKASSLAGAS